MSSSGRRGRGVFVGFLVLMALAIGTFAFLYYRLVYYQRVSAYHIPADASFGARLDLEQVVLFAPVREHLLPVFLSRRGADAPASDAKGKAQLERIEEKTGINLGMDLREVVVLYRASDAQSGAIIGGRFPREGVLEGLLALFTEDGLPCALNEGRLECSPPHLLVAQAADGALLVATSPGLLNDMLPSGAGYQNLGLETDGPGSFGLRMPGVPLGAGSLLERWPPFRELGTVERLEGHLRLEQQVTVTLEAVPVAGKSLESWLPEMEQLRSLLQLFSKFAPGRDYAGERALLGRLQFGLPGGGRLSAVGVWEEEEIAQGARSLASVLELWLRTH